MVVETKHNQLPSWLQAYIRPTDLAHIAAAIKQVEVSTSGEVVPMVVRRSMVTGHVFPLVLLILAFFYVTAEALLGESALHGEHALWILVELTAIGLVAQLLSRLVWVQRLMTSDADLRRQVMRRAEAEFCQAGLHRTVDATGVLIFVSMAERQAVVLADQGIAKRLAPDVWSEAVSLITRSVKDAGLGQGFVEAIRRCGELLKRHFPIQDHDRNELHDTLVIKE